MTLAWKSEQGFEKNTLTEADIQGFLKKKSKEINNLFKKSLIIDVVLNSSSTLQKYNVLIYKNIWAWKKSLALHFMIFGFLYCWW